MNRSSSVSSRLELVNAAVTDAELTVVRRVAFGHSNASSSTPVPGSQPAITFEAFGAKTFGLSAEAVRLRPEDWDCGACHPTFMGNPSAVTGKFIVGDTRDWGCGSSQVYGLQAFARALSAANVTAWIFFYESDAANPPFVSGLGSRILYSGETRDPPDLREFVFIESNSHGPLFESFSSIEPLRTAAVTQRTRGYRPTSMEPAYQTAFLFLSTSGAATPTQKCASIG